MDFSTLRADGRVYLDHNATTPIASQVADRVPAWLRAWGNPSSIHFSGRGPKALMRDARDEFARMIGASTLEVIFTSGGSEANNLALKGLFEALQKPSLVPRESRPRFLVSSVEHPSVRRAAEALVARGVELEIIPVRRTGEVDLENFERMVDEKTALVSMLYANNETGNIFPIRQMAEIAHKKGAYFHSDCVQALGKIPVNVRELGVDFATFSGHKFYSLKGAGVLYAKKGVPLESLIHGGGQERHRRGGTENTLAIAALGMMCQYRGEVAERARQVRELRDHLETRILSEISNVTVTGGESERLPNTSSLVIKGVDGEILLMNLDMRGFSVSTGAACSSGSPEPSPVLLAMGLSRGEAQSSLRVGLGWDTSPEEVDDFVSVLVEVVKHIRSLPASPESGSSGGSSHASPARVSPAHLSQAIEAN
jgi:cysteine desulfurase